MDERQRTLYAQRSVAAGGVGEQRHDHDVPGERGPLLPAAAAAPHLPVAARAAPPHGRHLPESGRARVAAPGERCARTDNLYLNIVHCVTN